MSLSPRFEDWAPTLVGEGYSEAYLEESRANSLHFEDSRLTEMSSGSDRGACLRYLFDDPESPEGPPRTVHGSLNSLEAGAARALAERLLGKGARRAPPRAAAARRSEAVVLRDPFGVATEEKVALLAAADRAARAESAHVIQVDITYAERRKSYAVLNSDGEQRAHARSTVIFVVSVTAAKDGVLQTGTEVLGSLKGFELSGALDPVRAAGAAARLAVEKLSAPVARAGEMPVVLAASAGGTFVHEAIGHSLEADHVQEGSSPHYVGKLGKVVAPEFLSIVDDPTLPFARGSYPFDDEGCPARPTPLVQNGVLVDYLYDRVTARRGKAEPNAHGRRESFRHRPIPRMSNLYIAPGKDDPADILRSLDRGLLVTRMGGGQVNTATGEFVFGVDEGFWVEGGKIRHRVRDANMLGVGPEVLASIDRLGWDIGWGIGTCGKDGQGVPVSDGQPTLRIPKLLIGGREEGA
ncbi:MAG TPA: TldD/PmbA family protein [Elusimicrobiota bacterium]|nr:TldD/PmbA family protein [Elusimicrobiota bacterium]